MKFKCFSFRFVSFFFSNYQGIRKRMPVSDEVLDVTVRAAISEEMMCSKFRITAMNTYVGITTIYFFL